MEPLREHQRWNEQRFGCNAAVESKLEVLRVRALLCKQASQFEEMHVLMRARTRNGIKDADKKASNNGSTRNSHRKSRAQTEWSCLRPTEIHD